MRPNGFSIFVDSLRFQNFGEFWTPKKGDLVAVRKSNGKLRYILVVKHDATLNDSEKIYGCIIFSMETSEEGDRIEGEMRMHHLGELLPISCEIRVG
jgi:hypothetical protein